MLDSVVVVKVTTLFVTQPLMTLKLKDDFLGMIDGKIVVSEADRLMHH